MFPRLRSPITRLSGSASLTPRLLMRYCDTPSESVSVLPKTNNYKIHLHPISMSATTRYICNSESWFYVCWDPEIQLLSRISPPNICLERHLHGYSLAMKILFYGKVNDPHFCAVLIQQLRLNKILLNISHKEKSFTNLQFDLKDEYCWVYSVCTQTLDVMWNIL